VKTTAQSRTEVTFEMYSRKDANYTLYATVRVVNTVTNFYQTWLYAHKINVDAYLSNQVTGGLMVNCGDELISTSSVLLVLCKNE